MATGGFDESFEVLVCQVCLENMVDREPRTLACNHTFCSGCLSKLLNNGCIECPTCRTKCQPQDGNLTSFPVNFNLAKVQEREKELVLNRDYLCQSCVLHDTKAKAIAKCVQCFRLLCPKCLEKHNNVPVCKEHTVHELTSGCKQEDGRCKRHRQEISYICHHCNIGLCVDCILSDEHQNHSDRLETFQYGVQTAKNILKEERANMLISLDIFRARHHLCQADLEKTEALFHSIDREFTETVERLKMERHRLREKVKTEHVQYKQITMDTLSSLSNKIESVANEIDEVCKSDKKETFYDFSDIHRAILSIKQSIEDTSKLSISLPGASMIYLRPVQCQDNLIGTLESGLRILSPDAKASLLLTMERVEDTVLSRPVQLCPVKGEFVLLADIGLKYVFKLNKTGKLVAKYETETFLTSVSVYDNQVFVGYPRKLVKLVDGHFPKEEKLSYVPEGETIISKILSIDRDVFVLTDLRDKSVWTFNAKTRKTEKVVSELQFPTFISMVREGTSHKYLITDRLQNCVFVYDHNWRLVSTIGGPDAEQGNFNQPGATVSLDYTGHVLVADRSNHRVSLFTLDGSFVRFVLTEKDGIKYPRGLAFLSPFLWVTSFKCTKNEANVKCFTFI